MIIAATMMLSSRGFLATRSFAAAATTTASKKNDVAVKKRGYPLMKPIQVSPSLRTFLGVPEMSRSEVVKKIWEYVKENGLQKPEDKRRIMCDKKLKTIFAGKDEVGMFEITKLLSPHFVKTAE